MKSTGARKSRGAVWPRSRFTALLVFHDAVQHQVERAELVFHDARVDVGANPVAGGRRDEWAHVAPATTVSRAKGRRADKSS